MTVYPRCNGCGELVHPLFDWCDHQQSYLCDGCLAALESSHD
ncbi:hypothetical protein SEA_DAKITI_98 [Gordonia phage Dakiti]|nr:hypothetical protein SEA_DAKITI_98 [Gordonia phage Dakiti]